MSTFVLQSHLRAPDSLDDDRRSVPNHLYKQLCFVRMNRKLLAKHDVCTICMDPFRLRQSAVKLLCCLNAFHRGCLRKWSQRRNSCPVCRNAVVVESPANVPPKEEDEPPQSSDRDERRQEDDDNSVLGEFFRLQDDLFRDLHAARDDYFRVVHRILFGDDLEDQLLEGERS